MPQGRQLVGLRRVVAPEGLHAAVFVGRGFLRCGPLIALVVQSCPGDHPVGARFEVEGDGVAAVQFAFFNAPLEEVMAVGIVEEERQVVHFVLQGIGKLHVVVIFEM